MSYEITHRMIQYLVDENPFSGSQNWEFVYNFSLSSDSSDSFLLHCAKATFHAKPINKVGEIARDN